MPWWLICYVGAVITAMAIATVQNLYCLDASAWAAWVQAIGSMLALGAGLLYIRYQAGMSHRAQRNAVIGLLDVAILSFKGREFAHMTTEQKYGHYETMNMNPVIYARDKLFDIQPSELRSPATVMALADAIESLSQLIALQRTETQNPQVNEARMSITTDFVDGNLTVVTESRDKIASDR